MTPPPAHVQQPTPHPNADCTSGRAAPVIDGLITGYEAFRAAYAASGGGSYAGAPINRSTDALLGVAFMGVFLASTIYGTVNTSNCKRLKEGPGPDELVPGITRELPSEPEPPAPAKTSIEQHWAEPPPPPLPPLPPPSTAPTPTPAPTRSEAAPAVAPAPSAAPPAPAFPP